MKGLIIKSPWIELILEGKKTWEIRGSNTKIRGPIVLIKSGSKKAFGEVNIIDSRELCLEDYQESRRFQLVARILFSYLIRRRMLGYSINQ